jgi:hypothetical protein
MLFGLGMLIPFVVSGIDGQGADDLIGGILILAALFWPGPEYEADAGNTIYSFHGRGWPSKRHVAEVMGDNIRKWDGLVFRHWRFPFPPSWTKARQYE